MKRNLPNKILKRHLFLLRLIAFFAISPSLFYAQSNRLSFHQLSPEEGLSQASNDYVYQDSKGFVWLSSIDGLNRFDGKNVKIYKSISGDSTSLLGNIITSNFFEDNESNLWFTTYEGIHCYVRAYDHFQHFQLKNDSGEKLKQDYYAFHLDSKDKLWVRIGDGVTGRLFLFDIKKYGSQNLCFIDGQKNFPITDTSRKIEQVFSFRFNDQFGFKILDIASGLNSVSFFDGSQKEFPQVVVYDANLEDSKNYYLGTDKGILVFDPLTKENQLHNEFENSSIGIVRSTLNINDSILWAATSQFGILIFNKKTKQFVNRIPFEPQRKLGLKLERIDFLHKDRNENIWITNSREGVNFVNLQKRKFATPPEFIDQNISAIFENTKGEIFCSYDKDFVGYYHSSKTKIHNSPTPIPETITKRPIRFFFEDGENQTWAATSRYLLKWNALKTEFEFDQMFPNSFLFVYKNQRDKILISTYGGIYEWKKENNDIKISPATALKEYQKELATAIFEDKKGRLYLALDASRLLILESDGSTYSKLNTIEGIGYAKSFFEEGENIWVATSTGILKINSNDLSSHMLNEENDGSPSENYYSIIPDERGSFWLSCNRGIIRYFPNEKKHRRYTLVDGLQANEYNTNAFLKTSQGEIWMGGTKGLNRFFPNEIHDLSLLPHVQITRIQVNDGFKKTEKQIGELDELILEHSENTVSFNFVGLEYSDPENNLLQYQMENRDDEWVMAQKNGFARYSNLPSGEYLFKVKAANSDGVWNEVPRQIKIFIKTPWYRTWWFYTFCILFVVGIIYGVSMYRLQQALKFEKLRVKISSDLHDDVGGLLAGLTMQSELLELTAAEERKPKLERISELSRKAMSRMRDTVWAIDARKDKFENLLDRVREHAAETLEMKNISFDLKIGNIALDKNLNSQIRQNLYLICKEAITNTAKYSNGDQLNIIFEKLGRNGISMTIHDNGKVVEKEYKSSGLGMSNMKMRAEQIGGRLEVNRENGFLIKLILD